MENANAKVVGILENLMRSHSSVFNRKKSNDSPPDSPDPIPHLSALANSVVSRCSKYSLPLSPLLQLSLNQSFPGWHVRARVLSFQRLKTRPPPLPGIYYNKLEMLSSILQEPGLKSCFCRGERWLTSQIHDLQFMFSTKQAHCVIDLCKKKNVSI